MDIIIREIMPLDYAEVVLLWRDEIGNTKVNQENMNDVMAKMNKDDNYRTFVALCDNKVVGFITTLQAMAVGFEVGFLWICGLAVSGSYHGKGIGSKLLKHVENFAYNRGLSSVILNSGMQRTRAHEFYKHNGYDNHSYCFTKRPSKN